MIYRILAVIAVLVLVAGTFLLGRSDRDREQPSAAGPVPTDPGYSSRDAAVVETGPDGNPLYRLVAERISQPPHEDTVTLEHLTMDYRTRAGNAWHLRADHGTLPPDARHVELEGTVVVNGPIVEPGTARTTGAGTPLKPSLARNRRPAAPQHEIVMSTERLLVDTEKETATTAAPVTLTWSGQRLLSRGIAANFKDQTVKLESDVHGHFLPP